MKFLLPILIKLSRKVPETTMIHYSNHSRKQIQFNYPREEYATNSVTSELENYRSWILNVTSLSNFNALKPQIHQLTQKTWYQVKDMIISVVARNSLCIKINLIEMVLLIDKERAIESTRIEKPETAESTKMDYRAPWILQEQFQFRRIKETLPCKIDPNYILNLWF